jgi:hypothetical protein
MAFKIRDLLIHAVPESGGGPFGCRGKMTNLAWCIGGKTQVVCSCPGKMTHPYWGTCRGKHTQHREWGDAGDPAEVLEELIEIKAQLKAAIAEVDEEIVEIEEALRPKTAEEVEELKSKLKEALAELDTMKFDPEKK